MMCVRRLLLLVVLVLCPVSAFAGSITFDFQTQFSNTVQPGGPAPWFSVNINDQTAAAGYDVRITLSTGGLAPGEFITAVYLNVNDTLFPNTAASSTSGFFLTPGMTGFAAGNNCCQADGDGKYDYRFDFTSSNSDANRFLAGQTRVFDLAYHTGVLTAASFNALSQPQGGSGPFFAAAHLQGIAPNGSQSTWIADNTTGVCIGADCPVINPEVIDGTMPEPASVVLMASGLLGLIVVARRRRHAVR